MCCVAWSIYASSISPAFILMTLGGLILFVYDHVQADCNSGVHSTKTRLKWKWQRRGKFCSGGGGGGGRVSATCAVVHRAELPPLHRPGDPSWRPPHGGCQRLSEPSGVLSFDVFLMGSPRPPAAAETRSVLAGSCVAPLISMTCLTCCFLWSFTICWVCVYFIYVFILRKSWLRSGDQRPPPLLIARCRSFKPPHFLGSVKSAASGVVKWNSRPWFWPVISWASHQAANAALQFFQLKTPDYEPPVVNVGSASGAGSRSDSCLKELLF